MLAVFTVLFLYVYIVSPALAMYSWLRWAHSRRRRSRNVRISLVGLAFGSSALVLGVAAVAFSSMRRGTFLYLAPRLHFFYLPGLALSITAVLIAAIGAFHSNPIRLKALMVACGALDLWFLAGSSS